MEALTAVGLASNIVQFITFARELVLTTRSMSRSADGALVENLEIEAVTRELRTLSDSLKVPLQLKNGISANNTALKEEEALKKLCDGCRNVASLLIDKIGGLKVDATASGKMGRKWATFRQALNSVFAADEIEELSARLDRYQNAINTTLLASLRSRVNKVEMTIEARDATMSERLLGRMDKINKWQADLIDTLHQNKWQPNEPHHVELFAHQLMTGVRIDKETLNKRQIHHLLQFEEIADRHGMIAEAHKRTFEWVLKQGSPQVLASEGPVPGDQSMQGPQWDSFPDWLCGDQSLYWITGKPGSGKSTLMKFLFNHPQTKKSAAIWSKGDLVTAGFFFWNSGLPIQMSRIGLLQTLLFQCLVKHGDLIPDLFPTRWSRYTLFGGDMRPWTWSELTGALKKLLSMDQLSFLIFIDGLDEFDGDHQDLVSLVMELRVLSPKTIKLCVASRPWLVFEESFRGVPWLRMEDLTRQDIQLYVKENMQESSRWTDFREFMPDEANKMIIEITNKASGVFLWVILVVASLLKGLRDGDNVEDLWKRIGELPIELEELFQKILGDVNPRYFAEACKMFQLATTAFDSLSLLEMSLALDGCSVAISAPVGRLKPKEVAFRAETMRRQMISRSKGLLEVSSTRGSLDRAKVGYLHRTVKDFFENERAQEYIRSGAPDFDAPLMLAASFLRKVKISPKHHDPRNWDGFWYPFVCCIDYIRFRKSNDDATAIDILDALSRAGNAYWGQEPFSSSRYDQNSLSPSRDDTWLEKLVAESAIRIDNEHWRHLVSQCPVRKAARTSQGNNPTPERIYVTRKELPHWVNTCYLADLSTSHPLYNQQLSSRPSLLNSFFELAFVLQINFYVLHWMSPEVCHSLIDGWPLLTGAIIEGNFPMALHLLSLGADPNIKENLKYTFRSPWAYFLEHTRGRTGTKLAWPNLLAVSQRTRAPSDLSVVSTVAESFVQHGADIRLLEMEDIERLFADMNAADKDALKAKVLAKKPKRKVKVQTRETKKKTNRQVSVTASRAERSWPLPRSPPPLPPLSALAHTPAPAQSSHSQSVSIRKAIKQKLYSLFKP